METILERSSEMEIKELTTPQLDLNILEKVRSVTAKMRKKTVSKFLKKGMKCHAYDLQLTLEDLMASLDQTEQSIYDVAQSKEEYLSLVAAKVDRIVLSAEVQLNFDKNFSLSYNSLQQPNLCHPWSVKCGSTHENSKRLYLWTTRSSNNNKSILTISQLLDDQPVVVVERKLTDDLCKSLFTTMIDEIEMQMFAIFFDQSKSKFADFVEKSETESFESAIKLAQETKTEGTVKVVVFDLEPLGQNGGFRAKGGERLYQFTLSCDIIGHVLFGSEPNTLLLISHSHASDKGNGTMEQFNLVAFSKNRPYKASIEYNIDFPLGESLFSPRTFVTYNKNRNILGFYVPHSLGLNLLRGNCETGKQMELLSEELEFQENNGAIAIYNIDSGSKPLVERKSFSETDRLSFLKTALPLKSHPGDLLDKIQRLGHYKETFETKLQLIAKLFKYYVFSFSDEQLIAVKHYHKYAFSGKTPANKKLCISLDLKECKSKFGYGYGVLVVKHHIILTSLYVALYSTLNTTTIVRAELGPILKDYRKCARCGKLEKKKRKNVDGKRIANFKVCRICKSYNFHLYWRQYPCHYCSLKCLQKDWPNHKKFHIIDGPLDRVCRQD